MSSVLIVEQREQAGSDSYNRFEYQVHWIVCHIIGKLQEDAECIVFCEFLDDMADFLSAEQSLNLPFCRWISLLYFCSTCLNRFFCMYFGRTCCSTASVTSGTSAEQYDNISRI